LLFSAAGCSATATCEPPHHQKHLTTAKHHAIEGRTPPKPPADSKTPLKDEQVPELHGKMPNVTSETVEKTIVFEGFTATAGCYYHLHLLPATCAPKAAADNRMPYLLLLLVDRTSNKNTCRRKTPCH